MMVSRLLLYRLLHYLGRLNYLVVVFSWAVLRLMGQVGIGNTSVQLFRRHVVGTLIRVVLVHVLHNTASSSGKR